MKSRQMWKMCMHSYTFQIWNQLKEKNKFVYLVLNVFSLVSFMLLISIHLILIFQDSFWKHVLREDLFFLKQSWFANKVTWADTANHHCNHHERKICVVFPLLEIFRNFLTQGSICCCLLKSPSLWNFMLPARKLRTKLIKREKKWNK